MINERHEKFSKVGELFNLFEEIKTERKIKLIVVHHSATTRAINIGAKDIDRWHTERWGIDSGCGYHYIIRRSGEIERGRGINWNGAHTRGANTGSIGICLEGGKTNGKEGKCQLFDSEQEIKLLYLVRRIKQFLGRKIKVVGHSEVRGSSTLCPAIDMPLFRKNLMLQEMIPTVGYS